MNISFNATNQDINKRITTKRLINTIKNIYAIEELRSKIGNTLLFLLVYRLGSFVVLPGVNPDSLDALKQQTSEGILGLLNMFSGGAFSNASIFK